MFIFSYLLTFTFSYKGLLSGEELFTSLFVAEYRASGGMAPGRDRPLWISSAERPLSASL